MAERKPEESAAARAACPNCGRPGAAAFRPFCSARCRDIDLHRWLTGQYAIPAGEDSDEDGALPETRAPGVGSGEEPERD